MIRRSFHGLEFLVVIGRQIDRRTLVPGALAWRLILETEVEHETLFHLIADTRIRNFRFAY